MPPDTVTTATRWPRPCPLRAGARNRRGYIRPRSTPA